MVKKTLIFIILILSITTANASVLIDSFRHENNLCFDGCHTRFSYFSDDADQICGNCHSYGLNVAKLESKHNPNICTGCHQINDKDTFHTVHRKVSCDTECHIVQNKKVSISTITLNKCESCHTMKIHTLHENNLSELCSTCHGSAVSSKTNIFSSSSSSSVGFSFDLKSDYKKYTLYEIFTTLVSNLKGEQT